MKSGIRIIRALMPRRDCQEVSLTRFLDPDMQPLLDAYEDSVRSFILAYLQSCDPSNEFADEIDAYTSNDNRGGEP